MGPLTIRCDGPESANFAPARPLHPGAGRPTGFPPLLALTAVLCLLFASCSSWVPTQVGDDDAGDDDAGDDDTGDDDAGDDDTGDDDTGDDDTGDDDTGDDDAGDDDAGDDDAGDDDTEPPPDPCSPNAAERLCGLGGPTLSVTAGYGTEITEVELSDCGDDYFHPLPISRGLPADVLGLYVGWETFSSRTSGSEIAGGIAYVTEAPSNYYVSWLVPFNDFGGDDRSWVLTGGDDQLASVVFPQTEDTETPSDCVTIWPYTLEPTGSTAQARYTLRTGSESGGVLYLDVAIVQDSGATSAQIQAALESASVILSQGTQVGGSGGTSLQTDSFYSVNNAVYANLSVEDASLWDLRALPLGNIERNVKVFVINAFDENFLGLSGGIPGPLGYHDLGTSGIVVAAGPHMSGTEMETDYMAMTIAHELGHYLGLFHTTEDGGEEHDPLTDTPECAESATTPSDCPDGTNLMFWTGGSDDDQTTISLEQANVINFSPVVQ